MIAPGDWFVTEGEGDGEPLIVANNEDVICIICRNDFTCLDDRANGNLIAASTKLLAAAEELLALMNSVPDNAAGGQDDRVFAHYEFDNLRIAIAKAKGIA